MFFAQWWVLDLISESLRRLQDQCAWFEPRTRSGQRTSGGGRPRPPPQIRVMIHTNPAPSTLCLHGTFGCLAEMAI